MWRVHSPGHMSGKGKARGVLGQGALATDPLALAEVLHDPTGAEAIGVRLARLDRPDCPRLHDDRVGLRLATTDLGPGTEYVPDRWSRDGSGASENLGMRAILELRCSHRARCPLPTLPSRATPVRPQYSARPEVRSRSGQKRHAVPRRGYSPCAASDDASRTIDGTARRPSHGVVPGHRQWRPITHLAPCRRTGSSNAGGPPRTRAACRDPVPRRPSRRWGVDRVRSVAGEPIQSSGGIQPSHRPHG